MYDKLKLLNVGVFSDHIIMSYTIKQMKQN